MGKAILILVAGTIINFGIANLNAGKNITDATGNAADYYSDTQARNIANSMAKMILDELADNNNWRINSTATKDFFKGTAMYTVEDAVFAGDSVVRINVTADYLDRSKSVAVYVARGSVPRTVNAPVTTNNEIESQGTMTIDGRDHTLAGALIPGKGTFGIWTTKTFTQSGTSNIGGTYAGVDYAPTMPGDPNVIRTGQIWPGGYPGTPDSVLGGARRGFPEGTLKAIAQSGVGGSQYVTDQSMLTYPLKGVTYVELPSGGAYKDMALNGSGILIVHNAAKNAQMRNIVPSTFRGLIIADDIIKIKNIIIGAVVGLSPNPPSGKFIGNGDGQVLYSSQAIRNAVGSALRNVRPVVLAWRE